MVKCLSIPYCTSIQDSFRFCMQKFKYLWALLIGDHDYFNNLSLIALKKMTEFLEISFKTVLYKLWSQMFSLNNIIFYKIFFLSKSLNIVSWKMVCLNTCHSWSWEVAWNINYFCIYVLRSSLCTLSYIADTVNKHTMTWVVLSVCLFLWHCLWMAS